jgi:hypothetical protein
MISKEEFQNRLCSLGTSDVVEQDMKPVRICDRAFENIVNEMDLFKGSFSKYETLSTTAVSKRFSRPAVLYDKENFELRSQDKERIETFQTKYLMSVLVVKISDRIKSEDIQERLGSENKTEKMRNYRKKQKEHAETF